MISQTNVFLFTVVIIVVLSVSASTRNLANDKHAYKENHNRLANYKRNCPCGPPKETLVRLSDVVFTESIETNQVCFMLSYWRRCNPRY